MRTKPQINSGSRKDMPAGTGLYVVGEDAARCPLVSVRHSVAVTDSMATIVSRQVYVNPRQESINVVYKYPLTHNCTPYACEVRISNPDKTRVTVLQAEIRPRAVAREEYSAAVARGETALLLEQDSTDVMVMAIGNVEAGYSVRVKFKWHQELVVEHMECDPRDMTTMTLTLQAMHVAKDHGALQRAQGRRAVRNVGVEVDVDMAPCGADVVQLMSPSHPASTERLARAAWRLGHPSPRDRTKGCAYCHRMQRGALGEEEREEVEEEDEEAEEAAPLKLSPCSRCGKTRYCSERCHTSHWNTHKKYCEVKPSGALSPEDLDMIDIARSIKAVRSLWKDGFISDAEEGKANELYSSLLETAGPACASPGARGKLAALEIYLQGLLRNARPVGLQTTKNVSPEEDFIVRIKVRNYPTASWLVEQISPNWFAHRISVFPQVPEAEKIHCEFILLVDRSGSMQGERMEKAKEALKLLMQSLDPDDDITFNILSFGSRYDSLFDALEPLNQGSLDRALRAIDGMRADYGGTDILTPVQGILREPIAEGFTRQVFLLTDGEDRQTDAIIRFVKGESMGTRFFTIGIGEGINPLLIDGVARGSGGHACYVRDDDGESLRVGVMEQLERAMHVSLRSPFFVFGPNKFNDMDPARPDDADALFNNTQTVYYYFSESCDPALWGSLCTRSTFNPADGNCGVNGTRERLAKVFIGNGHGPGVVSRLAARDRIDHGEGVMAAGDQTTGGWGGWGGGYEQRRVKERLEKWARDVEKLGLEMSLVTSRTSFVMVDRRTTPQAPATVTESVAPVQYAAAMPTAGGWGQQQGAWGGSGGQQGGEGLRGFHGGGSGGQQQGAVGVAALVAQSSGVRGFHGGGGGGGLRGFHGGPVGTQQGAVGVMLQPSGGGQQGGGGGGQQGAWGGSGGQQQGGGVQQGAWSGPSMFGGGGDDDDEEEEEESSDDPWGDDEAGDPALEAWKAQAAEPRKEEGEEQQRTPPRKEADLFSAILGACDIWGMWSDIGLVARFVGLAPGVIHKTRPIPLEHWLTALVLVRLRDTYAEERVQWRMIAKKSEKTLERGGWGNVMERAAEVLRGA